MKLVIAGCSGALGRASTTSFVADGDDVMIFTAEHTPTSRHRYRTCDGRTVGDCASERDDAVSVNLAGELVDRHATRSNSELLRSRVEPNHALVAAATAGAVLALGCR